MINTLKILESELFAEIINNTIQKRGRIRSAPKILTEIEMKQRIENRKNRMEKLNSTEHIQKRIDALENIKSEKQQIKTDAENEQKEKELKQNFINEQHKEITNFIQYENNIRLKIFREFYSTKKKYIDNFNIEKDKLKNIEIENTIIKQKQLIDGIKSKQIATILMLKYKNDENIQKELDKKKQENKEQLRIKNEQEQNFQNELKNNRLKLFEIESNKRITIYKEMKIYFNKIVDENNLIYKMKHL